MDDLIAYIIGKLFPVDASLLALFASNGLSYVNMRAPGGEEDVTYPVYIIYGKRGSGVSQGEPGERFTNGTLSIITYHRDQDNSANSAMWLLANQATYIIAGDKKNNIPGIIGKRLQGVDGKDSYIVTSCRPVDPNGPTPDPDPKVRKHTATYKVQLCRVS